jgi:radical SAM protein with 4Fe4S-binding SPASM domain
MERFNELLPVARSLGLEIISVVEQMDYYTDYYCGACGINMCVTPGGLVSTCVEAMDEKEYGIGELFIGKYDTGSGGIVIDWDKVARLRTRTYRSLEECVHCAFRTNCSGSCLIRAGRKNGTVMSVDKDACNMVKTVLGRKFREMAENVPVACPVDTSAKRDRNSFADLINLSREVAKGFDEIEQRPWTIETIIIEMMKQVGDLSRHFMAYEKYYLPDRAAHLRYKPSKDAIANELADILHNLIRIADYYGIDLEAVHIKARADESALINSLKSGLSPTDRSSPVIRPTEAPDDVFHPVQCLPHI